MFLSSLFLFHVFCIFSYTIFRHFSSANPKYVTPFHRFPSVRFFPLGITRMASLFLVRLPLCVQILLNIHFHVIIQSCVSKCAYCYLPYMLIFFNQCIILNINSELCIRDVQPIHTYIFGGEGVSDRTIVADPKSH